MQQDYNNHYNNFHFYVIHQCNDMNTARKLEYNEIISNNSLENGYNQTIPTGAYTFNRENYTLKRQICISKNKVMKLLNSKDLSDDILIHNLCIALECSEKEITKNIYN